LNKFNCLFYIPLESFVFILEFSVFLGVLLHFKGECGLVAEYFVEIEKLLTSLAPVVISDFDIIQLGNLREPLNHETFEDTHVADIVVLYH